MDGRLQISIKDIENKRKRGEPNSQSLIKRHDPSFWVIEHDRKRIGHALRLRLKD